MIAARGGAAMAALCLIACSWRAHGQQDDKIMAAEALFRDARELMGKGRPDEACPKLEKSLELDPAMGTRYRLAECYEAVGRPASAWQLYVAVADEAAEREDEPRERVARERASRLAPKISRLTVTVDEPSDDLVILLDGRSLDRALWGVGVPLDPGEHAIEARAGERQVMQQVVTIGETGEALSVVIPAAGDDPILEPAIEPADGGAATVMLSLGIATAGLGVIGMGVAIGLGIRAKDRYDGAPGCETTAVCQDAEGFDERQAARALGDTATAVFVAGAVLSGIGITMAATSPLLEGPSAVSLQISPRGLSLRGAF